MNKPTTAPNTAIGTDNKTEKGKDQLSYSAARIRKTNVIDSANSGPDPPAFFSWYDRSDQSNPISGGSVLRAVSSSASSACPELYPGAAAPVTSAPRYTLNRLVYCGPNAGLVVSSADSGTIESSLLRT